MEDEVKALFALIEAQRTAREHLLARLEQVPALRYLRQAPGLVGVIESWKDSLSKGTLALKDVDLLEHDLHDVLHGSEEFDISEEDRDYWREGLARHPAFVAFWVREKDEAARLHMLSGKKPYLV